MVDPTDEPVGYLQVVFVLHEHVAVAVDADVGELDESGFYAGGGCGLDESLAGFEAWTPARRGLYVVTKEDKDGDVEERLHVGFGIGAGAGFDGDDAGNAFGADPGGLEGEDAGLGVADEDGAVEADG